MRKFASTLFFVLVLVLLVYSPAQAARYVLKQGQQFALCRDYVAALNASKARFPMACARHFPPQFKKFAEPKWTPLDPKAQPLSLYEQMYAIWMTGSRPDDISWDWERDHWIKPALAAGTIQLARARVYLSGQWRTVLRFAYKPCHESQAWFEKGPHPTTYRYFVLDEKTGKLMKKYWGMATYGPHGLFYYDGRAFIDQFSGVSIHSLRTFFKGEGPAGELSVTAQPFGLLSGVCDVSVYYELPGTEKSDNTRTQP